MERQLVHRLVLHAAALSLLGGVLATHPDRPSQPLTPLQPNPDYPSNVPSLIQRLMSDGYLLAPIKPTTKKTLAPSTHPARILSISSGELQYGELDLSSTIPPRLPSSYQEAFASAEETVRITGKRFTSEDIVDAFKSASLLVQCAIRVETPSLNPYTIGKEFELGPGQFHRKGKLARFYQDGYTNPFDPYQVVEFMGYQFKLGDANHWAGVRDGKC